LLSGPQWHTQRQQAQTEMQEVPSEHQCPGLSSDKVNSHKKLGGVTQTSQSNGMFYIM